MPTYLKSNEEEVRYIRKKRKTKYYSYAMYASGYYSKNYRRYTMDAAKILLDMPPKSKERKAIEYLISIRDKENKCEINLKPKEKKDWFYDGVAVLVKKELAGKIESGLYMINPFFIQPLNMSDAIALDWDTI